MATHPWRDLVANLTPERATELRIDVADELRLLDRAKALADKVPPLSLVFDPITAVMTGSVVVDGKSYGLECHDVPPEKIPQVRKHLTHSLVTTALLLLMGHEDPEKAAASVSPADQELLSYARVAWRSAPRL